MTRRLPINLSALRDIGWTHWDPIGIAQLVDRFDEGCADEYDTYLLRVVGMVRNGKSDDEAIAYLEWVASDYMGLGPALTSERPASASATVQAIRAYVATLDA